MRSIAYEHNVIKKAHMNNDENQFYRLIESSPDAIFISGQGRFVYANPAAIQLFGATSQGQLRGQYVIERIHPEFRAVIAERIRLMHEQGKTAPLLEQKYLRLDGTSVDVEVTAVPFLYAGEECGLVFVRNITQRKSASCCNSIRTPGTISLIVERIGRWIGKKTNGRLCRI